MRKLLSGILLALLCVGFVSFSFRVQPAKGWTDGTVTIKSDGSIDPPYAPITRDGNIYTLTANIWSSANGISIEKSNIIIDGAGHVIRGTGDWGYYAILTFQQNVTVKNITVEGFYEGIYLYHSSKSCVCEATITNITRLGLVLSNCSDCNVTEVNISANTWGIALDDFSSNNKIVGNTVSSNNKTGIQVGIYSHNNTILENSIANSQYGVWFEYSWDNKIYHNVFRNNSQEAYIAPLGIEQSWDDGYPSGGNYWSDYESINPNATEIDHTGLWNTPYVLDPNNQDNYPLIQPLYQPIQGPTANFTYSQATVKVEEQIVFNASSSLAGSNGTYPTPITGYVWDFGDGNVTPTAQPIIEHSYSFGGAFNVTLTVTDSQDLTSSCSNTITVMMPTALSISTNSTSSVLGYIVNIYGNLSDARENGLANETVMLCYTFSGSSTWYPISSGSTDAHGQYYVQWMPSATGYFTIEAEWAGNATHIASNSTVNLSVLPYQSSYAFSIESNSTISDLTFDTTSQRLSFSASGENGTTGYARVTIAKALVPDITRLKVRLDGIDYNYSAVSFDDSWLLTFTYNHSLHNVEVYLDMNAVPEIPKFLIFPIFMIATLLMIIIRKGKIKSPRRQIETPFSLVNRRATLKNFYQHSEICFTFEV
jgi:parallel beta-helix repeat protein